MAQARSYAARARAAQKILAGFSQEQVDRIVEAMGEAGRKEAERLARMAHEETGFGNVKDKTTKNLFASVHVVNYIRPIKTVGVLREDTANKILEIAEPMGVVAAIVPSTNPTSTAIYKALVSIKARNAVVVSPHPSARNCITEAVRVIHGPAVAAGLPPDALLCLSEVSLEGTQELMKSKDTGVILATGGIGLVRAAYSSGRPAYGVGPGNVPVYVDASADVAKAARDIVNGKTFDYGTLCSSEQAVVCHTAVKDQMIVELKKNGCYFLNEAETTALSAVAVLPQRMPNPKIVGRPATFIAEKAGLKVPADTRALVAPLTGVGRDFPLSIEKLSPILAFYEVKDWREGSERCLQLLRYGGTGHTMGIHCKDEKLVREFAMDKPVYRVIVNTQTAMGSTGYTTGLAPSMSLGCGAYAGNITSDNITPLHLLNTKRVAFENPREGRPSAATAPAAGLREQVAAFVDQRAPAQPAPAAPPAAAAKPAPAPPASPAVDFVAEDDVKRALREGRVIRHKARAIITPAARDAASGTNVLVPER